MVSVYTNCERSLEWPSGQTVQHDAVVHITIRVPVEVAVVEQVLDVKDMASQEQSATSVTATS